MQRTALYRYVDTEQISEDILNSTLGRKRIQGNGGELERAVCLEHVRDYVISKHQDQQIVYPEDDSKGSLLQSNDFLVLAP